MKKTILALLVAKFQGVRKDALGVLAGVLALQATNEDEAKALVDKVTDAQVTEFAKDYRAGVDKEVSESNKTFETNLRKKYDFKEKQNEPGIPPTENPNDIAAIVKEAVAAAVKPFEENAALGGASGKPMFAQKNEDGISKGVADYVASLKPENNELSGKEV